MGRHTQQSVFSVRSGFIITFSKRQTHFLLRESYITAASSIIYKTCPTYSSCGSSRRGSINSCSTSSGGSSSGSIYSSIRSMNIVVLLLVLVFDVVVV